MTNPDLSARFPKMRPVTSAPPMARINGIGTGLYGKRDLDRETGAYVATLCFSVLFFPLVALRAYRVAPAQGRGWYFLGSEPLSGFAKLWNLCLVVAAIATAVAIPTITYWNSVEYKAGRQFAAARAMAARGEDAKAANGFLELALSGGPKSADATVELAKLIDAPFTASNSEQAATVFDDAARLGSRPGAIPPDALAAKGFKVAAALGDANPKASLALLQVLRHTVIDPRAIDQARQPLLRKWVNAEPNNPEPAIQLAEMLDAQQKTADAKKLLLPFRDKLGNGEGARILGSIAMHEGNYEDACALLWPYVQPRLKTFHDAEKTANDVTQSLYDREVDALRQNKGPKNFYDRMNAAGTDDQKKAIVQEYVGNRVRDNPHLRMAQEDLQKQSAVVPVALELGIVMLERAAGMPDAARRKLLEDAQGVFLSIQSAAGGSDEYKLFLGQVDYWLGKQDDGKKLFADYLKTKVRSPQALLELSMTYRRLGANSEARPLAEESYSKATSNDDRYNAAQVRSLLANDEDDRIAWLGRENTDEPMVKGELALARGRKAQTEGRDADASIQLHRAIDAYSAMPRNEFVYNELGLAHYTLFLSSGDRSDLDHCLESIQQAVALNPSDAILLFNAAATVMDASMTDLVSKDLDLRALRQGGDLAMMRYLYRDQASRDAMVQRMQDHPGIAKALSYADKAMVISPRNPRPYQLAFGIQSFAMNTAALRTIAQRLDAAGIDAGDQVAQLKDYLSGKDRDKLLSASHARLAQIRDATDAVKVKAGPSYAAGIDARVNAMISLELLGDPVAGLDDLLSLARQGEQADASAASISTTTTVYELRAMRALAQNDPATAALVKKYQQALGPEVLLGVIFSDEAAAQRAAALPDVQIVVQRVKEEWARFPKHPDPVDWAILRHLDPAAAQQAADLARADETLALNYHISLALAPGSPVESTEAAWYYLLTNQPEKTRAVQQKAKDLGIDLPAIR